MLGSTFAIAADFLLYVPVERQLNESHAVPNVILATLFCGCLAASYGTWAWLLRTPGGPRTTSAMLAIFIFGGACLVGVPWLTSSINMCYADRSFPIRGMAC